VQLAPAEDPAVTEAETGPDQAPAPPTAAQAGSNTLAPSAISLDRKTEELLEAVRTAGRFAEPRIDANRSATIRLAMSLLGEKFTPEEVVDQLRRRTAESKAPGRRRLG
jgi:hypothetical protein